MACGLPVESSRFALLPPFFPRTHSTVPAIISQVFPRACMELSRVLEFCLASLVHHRQFLQQTLPAGHRLFASALFLNPGLLDSLANQIACRVATPEDPIRPTGVPPHVLLAIKVDDLAVKMQSIDGVVPQVVSGIEQVLEQRAISSGAVTTAGLEASLEAAFQRFLSITQFPAASQDALEPDVSHHHLIQVPADFCIPSRASVQSIFTLWFLGEPPFRLLAEHHFSDRNLQKRFCDMRFFITKLEAKLKEGGHWVERPTSEEVSRMLTHVLDLIPQQTEGLQRKRRTSQLCWTTAVNILRRTAH